MRVSRVSVMRFWHLIKVPLGIGILLGLLVSNLIILANQSKESREDAKRAAESRQQLEDLIRETNDHLDCIAHYFTRIKRSGLVLKSLEDCHYIRQKTSNPSPNEVANPSPNPTPRTPQVVSPRPSPTPTARRTPTRPRTEDRSFLDCLPAKTRKLLNGILPKDNVLRSLPCQR